MRNIFLQLFVMQMLSLPLQGFAGRPAPDGMAGSQTDSVWFTWQNTCLHDATVFQVMTTEGITPVRWMWHFGNTGISHVAKPQYFFDTPGDYLVTLLVYDITGMTYQHSETVTINPLPSPVITGEEYIVCRDARNVLYYTPFKEGHSYKWDFEDEVVPSSHNYVYLDFDDETGLPKQVVLTLTETNEYGCIAHDDADILITHFTAPPEGIVIRKTASSSSRLLLCLVDDPEQFTYNWGSSSFTADSVMTTDFESGFIKDNFYNYPIDIDTVNHVYWVQILNPEQNNCSTTSYLGSLTGDELKKQKQTTGN